MLKLTKNIFLNSTTSFPFWLLYIFLQNIAHSRQYLSNCFNCFDQFLYYTCSELNKKKTIAKANINMFF